MVHDSTSLIVGHYTATVENADEVIRTLSRLLDQQQLIGGRVCLAGMDYRKKEIVCKELLVFWLIIMRSSFSKQMGLSDADASIFQENMVNTMTADALAPCVDMTSVDIVLTT